ncbi:MAG: ABC transporter ATP-binding protein [Candidatus Binatia bacterium]
MGAIVTAERAAYRYMGCGTAVGPLDFEARRGEFHLISGPSGCGKSTLARMLSGIIPHLYRGCLEGRVLIGGRVSAHVPLWEVSALVGLVSQNPAAQILGSTVGDEIAFGLENAGLASREIESRLGATLESFGLEGVAERDPRTLSGGEQQKLVLAALSARKPQVLVLDEPLSMLDTASAAHIVGHLRRLSQEGTAVVVFEHRSHCFARIEGLRKTRLAGTESAAWSLPELPARVPPFCLRVEGLSVELGGQAVLRDIDLNVAGGEVVAVVGANGTGKTTLLRALTGLQPHGGRSSGTPAGAPHLGLCFQNPDRQLFNATVRQEVLFGLTDHDETFYRRLLELLGLASYENTPPLLLSEGEKKRLALAIVLLRPGLCGVCLDEPTLGQDPCQRRVLGRIARRLAAAGYLCLLATHDLEWAAQWSDRVFELQDGRLVPSTEADTWGVPRDPQLRPAVVPPQSFVRPCRVDAQPH